MNKLREQDKEGLIKLIEDFGELDDISYQWDEPDGTMIRYAINQKSIPQLIHIIESRLTQNIRTATLNEVGEAVEARYKRGSDIYSASVNSGIDGAINAINNLRGD